MTYRQQTGGRAGAATPDPDSVRAEAERLVAAGLAALSMAADRIGAPTRERGGAAAAGFDALGDMLFGPAGHRRHSVANDSPECCRCPVCRMISAARRPSPEVAERLATGVGHLAEGAARVLRTVAGAAGAARGAGGGPGRRPPGSSGPAEPDPPAPDVAEPDLADPWTAATAAAAQPAPPSATAPGPWAATTVAGSPATAPPAATPAVAKKAVAKRAAATPAVARNAVAKRAAGKPAPGRPADPTDRDR
jgi:hypothetical protein